MAPSCLPDPHDHRDRGRIDLVGGVTDVDGDGHLDAVTGAFDGGSVTVLTGDGTGALTSTSGVFTGSGVIDVVAADFDADGNVDLALPQNGIGRVGVYAGDGTGRSPPP